MNRREMLLESLKWSALAAVGLTVKPPKVFALDTGVLVEQVGNPLRFPPAFTNGGTMTLANTTVEVWPGTTTNVKAINGSYPGPTVRIQRGTTFSATVVNQLAEPATVHWHGLIVPEAMDGHPKDPIPPGGSFTYTFPVMQRAGTYFYHSHAHMMTAEHVYKGFAGLFIVDDDNEIPLGLPRDAYDIPLVIQDRRSANQPQFTYSPTTLDTMNGYLGDTVLVNGTPEAYFEVSRTLYRFRLLNGSNARVYKIGFSDNHPFHIIATDGGLKDEAVPATSFFLAPGERVDILMDFSSYALNQSVLLKSLPFTGGGGSQGTELNILRFDVTGTQSSGGIVPAAMPPIPYYNPADVVRTRSFTLTMTMGANMHRINGLTFDLNRIDVEVPRNDLEEWRIVNGTTLFHPMHIHGVLFQVLARNGNTNLPPSDKGWKDTVLVNPSETVRTLVKFTDYAGIYLLHCHNLEHEDDGMMINVRVNNSTGVDGTQTTPTEFRLHQNSPNPFNPSTRITFDVPRESDVELEVFDIQGRKVVTLLNETVAAGRHTVEFRAADARGVPLPSGVYFYRMKADAGRSAPFVQTMRMIVLR